MNVSLRKILKSFVSLHLSKIIFLFSRKFLMKIPNHSSFVRTKSKEKCIDCNKSTNCVKVPGVGIDTYLATPNAENSEDDSGWNGHKNNEVSSNFT